MKLWKRCLSLFLTLSMVLTLLPVSVFATEPTETGEATENTTVQEELPAPQSSLSEDISGSCGENLSWTLATDGMLTISGSGEMINYTDSDTPWIAYWEDIRYVTIEEGVTSVGDGAFRDCQYLREAMLPASLTRIGADSFMRCGRLRELIIPEDVTEIGDNAFWFCGLLSVEIPDGVTAIGNYAFAWCGDLRSVKLPQSLETIGYSAFLDCGSLPMIVIPANVTSIEWDAFTGCENLNVYFEGDAPSVYFRGDGGPSFSDSTTLYYVEGTQGWESPTWMGWPTAQWIGNDSWSISDDGVLTIGGTGVMPDYDNDGNPNAPWLQYASDITALVIEDGVTSIGKSAFFMCTELVEATIPDSVISIGEEAFMNCHSLTALTIPQNVTEIGDGVGAYCFNMLAYTVEDGNPAYSSQDGVLFNKDQTHLLQYPLGARVEAYLIPDTVERIGDYAFTGCRMLRQLTIPDSVHNIGWVAFSGCDYLNSAGPLDSGCAIEFGWTEAVPDQAFNGCDNLTEVTIPASISVVGYESFARCSNLTTVHFMGAAPEVIPLDEEGNSFAEEATLYYCEGEEGWTTPVWNGYATIPQSKDITGTCGDNLTWVLTEDGTLVISGTGTMTDYTSLINIPWYDYWEMITAVVIEDGVTYIGENAFSGCINMKKIDIADTVSAIGFSAFNGCFSLEQIILPKGITSIECGTFRHCSALLEVILPEGVNEIKEYAFDDCSNLETIQIPSSLTSIGNGAFERCERLTDIYFLGDAPSVSWAGGVSSTFLDTVTLHFFANKSGWTLPTWSGYSAKIQNTDRAGLCGKELVWNLTDDGTLTITHIGIINGNGEMENYQNASEVPWAAFRDYILRVVVAPGVTTIGNYAFANCAALNEVSLPSSLRSIGDHAFYFCSGLAEIDIPSGVDNIGCYAFCGCSALTSIVVPEFITSLEEGVFSDCSKLVNVEFFRNNVELIGDYVFANCISLTRIALPGGLTTIGNGAFEGCRDLSEIKLHSSLNVIGRNAFRGCSSLKEIVLPYSVTSIATGTFSGCTSLMSVSFPDSLTTINANAFNGCINIESIAIPEGVTNIEAGTFAGCTSLTSVSIPNSVTTIGDCAFDGCRELPSITIPENVTSVGCNAFRNCTGLEIMYFLGDAPAAYALDDEAYASFPTDVLLSYQKGSNGWTTPTWKGYAAQSPDMILAEGSCGSNLTWQLTYGGTLTISGSGSMNGYYTNSPAPWYSYRDIISRTIIEQGVTSIGGSAFKDCSSLRNIQISDSVTTIQDRSFANCANLSNIVLPSGLNSIGEYAFYESNISRIHIPNGVEKIGCCAFRGCSNLEKVIIPASLKTFETGYVTSYWISTAVFKECYKLTTVGPIGSDCSIEVAWTETIPSEAFAGCDYLEEVIIPEGITTIGESAFSDCRNLLTIKFPDSLTDIGVSAFYYCESLKNVDLPDTVNSIGTSAFNYCSDLVSVKIPENIRTIGEKVFCNCSSLTTIDFPSQLISIELHAFAGSNITSVILPEGIKTLGYGAFQNCKNLEKVKIPDTLTTFDAGYGGDLTWIYGSFKGCTKLTSAGPIGSGCSIEYAWTDIIPASAFEGCSGLSKILIPDSVVTIGSRAFADCIKLDSIVLPNNITSIGQYAFSGCREITYIDIPSNVTFIGYGAFYGCNNLSYVRIPSSVDSIGIRFDIWTWPDFDYGVLQGCPIETAGPIGSNSSVEFGWETEIPGGIFADSDIKSIIFPVVLEKIGAHAFENCNLERITVPSRVTDIGAGAFNSCRLLSAVYFLGNAPSVDAVTSEEPSFPQNTVLYYVDGKEGWIDSEYYDSEAGTWNGYTLERWEGEPQNGISSTIGKLHLTEYSPDKVCCDRDHDLIFTFNNNVMPQAGCIRIINAENGKETLAVSVLDPSVSISGSTVTVAVPDDALEYNTSYYVNIDSGSFVSGSTVFYGVTGKDTWVFDTNPSELEGKGEIPLKWAKKKALFWVNDTSKPPIPDGTSEDYAYALAVWAEAAGVEGITVPVAKKMLNQKVALPATDQNGSTVLLSDGGTTVQQVMADLVFIENLQPYIAQFDKDLSGVNRFNEESAEKSLFILDQEAKLCEDAIGWYGQISTYINSRDRESNFMLSAAAPFAYVSILEAIKGATGTYYQFTEPFLDAVIKSNAHKESLLSLQSSADYETFMTNVDRLKTAVNGSKAIYTAATGDGVSSAISFGADLLSSTFIDSGNETLVDLGDAYKTASSTMSAVNLSMMLGSSIGMFPMVIDLHNSMLKRLENGTIALYFLSDYYIAENYPSVYRAVYSDGSFFPKADDAFGDYGYKLFPEYANQNPNDAVLHNWANYFTWPNAELSQRDKLYHLRKDLTNYAVLLNYVKSIDVDEAKELLVQYVSAKTNEEKTTIYTKCPVLVNVYNQQDELIATLSSEDEAIQDNPYGNLYLLGDNKETKCFVLFNDSYRVEMVPYGEGTMDVVILNSGPDGAMTSKCFEDVSLSVGDTFSTGSLDMSAPLVKETDGNTQMIDPVSSVPVTDLVLSGTQKLAVGESAALFANVFPVMASDKSVRWSSSDADILTVDELGIMTAHKVGIAEVTGTTSNGISKTWKVQTYLAVEMLSTDIFEAQMVVGESSQLTLSWEPVEADITGVTWLSSNPTVAEIGQDGTIYALKEGRTVITAEVDGCEVLVPVTVHENPLDVSVYQSDTEGMRIKFDFRNQTVAKTMSGTAIIGVYQNGRMMDLYWDEFNIAPGQEVLQYHAVDMLEPNQTYQVKVFLLDKENRPIQACTERVLFGKIGA